MRACLCVAASGLLQACDSTAANEDGKPIPLYIIDDVRQPDSSQVDVTVEQASIVGDTLHLRLSFAGCGPGRHDFSLAASSRLVESDPPEATVVLRHDGHDDCRALITLDVIAGLQPLQRVTGDHQTIRVRLYEPRALAPIDYLLIYSF